MRWRIRAPVLVLAILLAGCGAKSPLAPQARHESKALTSTLAGAPAIAPSLAPGQTANKESVAQHLEGPIGPGATYSMDRPANWNGDLVVYAHGYTSPCAPVALPAVAPLRDALLSMGFGVAYSSFSENGYALAEAVRQTHQLSGLYTARLGRPGRTFVMGISLGGIVGLKLIETYPKEYAGALLVSGVVGGTKAEVKYIGDTRVLFDCLYPGVLPGSLFNVPDCSYPFPAASIVGAIMSNPQPLGALLCLNPALPYASTTEAVTSVVNALGFQWMGAMDLFDRTHGHPLYDNAGVVYTCPALPPDALAGLNACVARYDATPDAEAYMRRDYEPSGELGIPLITLHNTRDPVVPFFHEALYYDKVVQQGRQAFLLQRSKDSYGHVDFTDPELLGAFVDLVRWVHLGSKPAV